MLPKALVDLHGPGWVDTLRPGQVSKKKAETQGTTLKIAGYWAFSFSQCVFSLVSTRDLFRASPRAVIIKYWLQLFQLTGIILIKIRPLTFSKAVSIVKEIEKRKESAFSKCPEHQFDHSLKLFSRQVSDCLSSGCLHLCLFFSQLETLQLKGLYFLLDMV